jgi:hypothetical protein
MVFLQFLEIRHVLDVMHCEKNLCENLLRTLLGKTDNPRTREDMMEMGIREELWLQPYPNDPDHFSKPHPMYVLTLAERQKFLDCIGALRAPTDYANSIHAHVSDGCLRFLKSHDYHILMQQVRYVYEKLFENEKCFICSVSAAMKNQNVGHVSELNGKYALCLRSSPTTVFIVHECTWREA